MPEKSFSGATDFRPGATKCPSCGATYHRWIWRDCQKVCALCSLNEALVSHGLEPCKTLPGVLARHLDRAAIKHALKLRGVQHG